MDSLRYGREIRWLFQAALLIFLVTIGLGMARGIGLIDFGTRTQTLTHLHSGVIGWITLGIMATALLIYGGREPRAAGDRFVTWTSLLLVVSAPIYILAWWTGNLPFRAISGVPLLLGIVLYVGWLVGQAGHIGYRRLTTPQLGVVIGLVSLVVGSTLGVLIQIQFASGTSFLPGEPIGAHAETQVYSYLMLASMSIAYWGLRGDDRTRRGTWMVWLFLVGGVIIALGFLTGQFDLALLYFPFVLAAMIIFLTLAGSRILAPGWLTRGPTRHYAIAVPFGLVFLGMFIYILVGFLVLELWADETEIPTNLIAAGAHPAFVGLVTNILFGILVHLNGERRDILPWADHVVFWGINAGVTGFFVVSVVGATGLYAVVTPILGLSILTGIVTHTLRLQAGGARGAPEPAPPPAGLAPS